MRSEENVRPRCKQYTPPAQTYISTCGWSARCPTCSRTPLSVSECCQRSACWWGWQWVAPVLDSPPQSVHSPTVLPHQSAHQHSHSEGSRLHQPWRGLGRPGETTRNPPPLTRKRNVSARSAPAGEWCVAWHLLMVTAVLAVLPIRPTDLGQELADMSLSVTSNKAIICCQSRDDGICPAD